MAEHSKFFDSLNPLDPDKVYTADDFMGFFGKLITNGVMKGEANMLKVETSGSNMNTIVDTGTAFLKAREYENDSKLSLTHEVEALGKSRIDRVVIRLMLNVDYREARAFVKKGVAGVAPVVPQLERTDDLYEISLAQVKVIGGQTYINVADIVDERGKVDICPWAGSKILPNFDADGLEQLVKDVIFTPENSLPLLNGVTGSITVQKNDMGLVALSTNFKTPTGGPYGTVTTLPTGFRPKNKVVIPINLVGRGTVLDGHVLEILPSGETVYKANSTTSGGFPTNVDFQGEVVYKSYS